MVPPTQQQQQEQRFPLPDLAAAPQIKRGVGVGATQEESS